MARSHGSDDHPHGGASGGGGGVPLSHHLRAGKAAGKRARKAGDAGKFSDEKKLIFFSNGGR